MLCDFWAMVSCEPPRELESPYLPTTTFRFTQNRSVRTCKV